MFLTELLEVIEYADHDEIKNLIPKLFKRIAKCISCEHLKTQDKFENGVSVYAKQPLWHARKANPSQAKPGVTRPRR